jgi:hypothetical protein
MRWIFGYLLPPIVALIVVGTLAGGVPAWSAVHGGGIAGSLILQREQCAHRDCT